MAIMGSKSEVKRSDCSVSFGIFDVVVVVFLRGRMKAVSSGIKESGQTVSNYLLPRSCRLSFLLFNLCYTKKEGAQL